MDNAISQELYELVKKVVPGDGVNYSVTVHNKNKKGQGYMGDICFLSLQDENTRKVFDLVVKETICDERMRSRLQTRDLFLNEIFFYTKVWPSFLTFQKNTSSVEIFDKIPKCFGTTSDDNAEKIVLENLKFQNFQISKKNQLFDKGQVEYILKEYGKFHAISFAFRALHPGEYSVLAEGLKNNFCKFNQAEAMKIGIERSNKLCFQSLQPGKDDAVIEKYKNYVENGPEILINSCIYKGKHSAILHGDCWSNNMMFKYDESGKFTDMRFLDFQLAKEGTPVTDLSYFLYAGTSKEVYNDLDYYLRVYHDSLSKKLEEFGCSSERLYPFEMLKSDWKVNCRLGFTMSLLIWRSKLTYELEGSETNTFFSAKYDEATFKIITRDLILHMYVNNFL